VSGGDIHGVDIILGLIRFATRGGCTVGFSCCSSFLVTDIRSRDTSVTEPLSTGHTVHIVQGTFHLGNDSFKGPIIQGRIILYSETPSTNYYPLSKVEIIYRF
jgi:hypothetical protein